MNLTKHTEHGGMSGSDETSCSVRRPPRLSHKTMNATISGLSTQLAPEALGDFGEEGYVIRSIFSVEACDSIIRNSQDWVSNELPEHGADSIRIAVDSEDVASALWARLKPVLRPKQQLTADGPFSDHSEEIWKPVGISPSLHLIRYNDSGHGVPGYGRQPDLENGKCTLKNVFISLTSTPSNIGGHVRLLLDTQRWMPFDERNFSNRSRSALDQDVLINVNTGLGDCLLLDWDVLRDTSAWNEEFGPRIILQADIVYERVKRRYSVCSDSINTLSHTDSDLGWLDRTYRKAAPVIGDSLEALDGAGWFNDGLPGEHEWDPRWWTGPIDKVNNNLLKVDDVSKKLAVLFSTGGFCPLHEGHIRTMERAKAAVEETGIEVLGGYFCPDHDDYVSRKCGKEAVSFDERLQLCYKAVAESDWLMADRSAALTTNVNFTRVADHLSRRLALEIRTHRPIHVIYVFGGDNARFTQAFVRRGSCVCVMRTGYDDMFTKFSTNELLQHHPRVLFTWNDAPLVSSTDIRGGDISSLPASIKKDWERIQGARRTQPSKNSEPVKLYMRDEGLWAVLPWKKLDLEWSKIEEAHATFRRNLKEAFVNAYAGMQPAVELLITPLEMQREIYKQKFANSQVVSLDACLPGTANFQISRRYTPLSEASHGYGPRPGAPSLEAQIDTIVPGVYDLFDDDCFSGRTKEFAIAQLSPQCTIRDFHTLCDSEGPIGLSGRDGTCRARLDNVDCRDYLIGCREGGLVLKLSGGSICRAPYVLPYVSPHVRSSMPAASEVRFSTAVWVLNRDFFASLDSKLCVADMSSAFQQLCLSMRFTGSDSMVAFCEWHIERLAQY